MGGKERHKRKKGNRGFLFLGEGRDPERLIELSRHVKETFGLEVALYSGREEVDEEILSEFDYVKVGPYIPEKGPLNERSTNQRLYKVERKDGELSLKDITSLFWRRGIDPNVK